MQFDLYRIITELTLEIPIYLRTGEQRKCVLHLCAFSDWPLCHTLCTRDCSIFEVGHLGHFELDSPFMAARLTFWQAADWTASAKRS